MGSSRVPKYAPQPLRLRPAVPVESVAAVTLPAPIQGLKWPFADSPRLADILDPAHNSFTMLRLMLALAVLVSHTIFLATGEHAAEPFVGLTGYSLGQYAVQGFFILSGILVTQSLAARCDIVDYIRARALRIFPALLVCVLLTALVAGPLLTFFGLPGYFLSSGVPAYIIETLSLSSGSSMLPGLFALNPVGGAVNQSLWTLKYEVACYIVVGGLAVLAWRLNASRTWALIGIAIWAVLMLLVRPSLSHTNSFPELLGYFALFFGTGVAAYLLRDHVRIAWQLLPVLALLFVLSWGTDMAEITSAAFVGYGLLWLATRRIGTARTVTNKNDYSYGVYIYSFPVTQALLQLWPGLNIVSLLAATLGITMVLAFLSWELIERPALRFARRARTSGAASQTTNDVDEVLSSEYVNAAANAAVNSVGADSVNAAGAGVEAMHVGSEVSNEPARTETSPAVATPAPTLVPLNVRPVPSSSTRAMIAPGVDRPRASIRRKPVLVSEAAADAAPVLDRSRLDARIAKIAGRPQLGPA